MEHNNIVIFLTIEEGSPTRAFLGISVITGLIMVGIASRLNLELLRSRCRLSNYLFRLL